MMTLKELAVLVADLRHAQREYFRTRSHDALNECKRKERKVDVVLKEILSDRPLLGVGDGEG